MTTTAPLLLDLALTAIRPSATNPRKSFDQAKLEELADSMRESGVTSPVLVRPAFDPENGLPDVYELVDGERRFRAAGLAGLVTIPALSREMTDAEVLDVQIVANLQRADVHPVEEAASYRALIEAAAYPSDPDALARELTAADVARKVGKSVDYVAKRMKLLALHDLASRLFAEGHLSLDHALRLAVLTAKNQVNAMVYLLGIAAWEIKRDKPAEAVIAQRMESWAEQQVMEHRQQFAGRRLVSPTEAELKRWIADHVLLQLSAATWRLDDAALVPAAGPCTTCPKRSGSSQALFGDLTAEEDVCLDAECFAGKRKARIQYLVNEAKVSGGILLKLSSKHGEEKLPADGVTEKTLLKHGQWVEAPNDAQGNRSCVAAAPGLLRDGDDAGKVLMVCALQSCKVHKHQVAGAKAAGLSSAALTPEQEERERKRKEKVEAAIGEETSLRMAVYDAMVATLPGSGLQVMRRLVMSAINSSEAYRIARWLGLLEIVHAKPGEGEWETHRRRAQVAQAALQGYINVASMEQLGPVVLEALIGGSRNVEAYEVGGHRQEEYRARMWAMAKDLGVNVSKVIAARNAKHAKWAEKKVAAKKVPAKKVAGKKAVAKKTPEKKAAKKGLSPAALKRMNEALKKRKAVKA
jgi:ParB family chromosome partitioning protein